MSVRAIAWAFGQSVGSPMAKLVLLKLADHADEAGECFPSIERIATDTEMNERSVRRHLEVLEAAGLIDRRTRGRGKVYRLNVAAKPDTESGNEQLTPDTESANTAPTPDSLSTTPDLSVHDTGQRVRSILNRQ